MAPEQNSQGLSRTNGTPQMRQMWIWLFIAAITFVARFIQVDNFSLCDDDFIYTVPNMASSYQEYVRNIKSDITHPPQARPVGHLLNHTFSYVSGLFPSLQYGYMISYALLVINGMLVFKLCSYFCNPLPALLAALGYILYPADPGRIILMFRAPVLCATLFSLLAALFYLRKWYLSALITAILPLLIYEFFYLPLVAIPIIAYVLKKERLKSVSIHLGILICIPILLVCIRRLLKDDRILAAATDLTGIVPRVFAGPFIGISAVAKLLSAVPSSFMHASDVGNVLCLLFLAAGVYLMLRATGSSIDVQEHFKVSHLLGIAAVGLGAAMLTYSLAFKVYYFPPNMNIGMMSGVHSAGAMGVCIAVGSLTELTLNIILKKCRALVIAGFSIYFSIFILYAIEFQRSELSLNGHYQRGYINDLVAHVRDLEEGDVIVVDVRGIPETRGFPAGEQFAKLFDAPRHFLNLPLGWKINPPIIGLSPNIDNTYGDCPVLGYPVSHNYPVSRYAQVVHYMLAYPRIDESGRVYLESGFVKRQLVNGHFIFFQWRDGHLTRVSDPISFFQKQFVPKQVGENTLRMSDLFSKLFPTEEDSSKWSVINDGNAFPK